jgi:ubiquinone/menaquinone biosynthesis C-methylase UbiE
MFHPCGPTFRELVRQALSSTEGGYDLLAPKFAYTPFRTPNEIIATALSCLGRAGALATALDMCCGTGAALWHLRPLCRDRVVGIDFSQGMLDMARRCTARAPGDAVIELVRGNVLHMPFCAAFDVAVCFGALGHILPQEQSLFVAQVAKVLKPGGRFILVTAPMPSRWSTRYWFARGFNAVLHLRNAVISPPFIMYYLTFLLSDAVALLAKHGFAVRVRHGLFAGPFRHLRVVIGVLEPG